MSARHHHYLSQCYLKGFTDGGGKDSKLKVFDIKNNRHFETGTRNVGGERDFNRIDLPDMDCNILESLLSSFESHAAKALREVDASGLFDGAHKEYILNLIALLAIRSPRMREHFQSLEKQLIEKTMQVVLSSEKIFNAQVASAKKNGEKFPENINYKDVKEFIAGKNYNINIPRERSIALEFNLIDALLPHLFDRNWMVICANNETGPFITSDRPVVLSWDDHDSVPPIYRNTPGFGMLNTHIYFPVSKNKALLGTFEGRQAKLSATRELVASLNSKLILNILTKQIFAPNMSFCFMASGGRILDGRHLLRAIKI